MYWTTGSGLVELNLTKAQARQGSHQGRCDDDIDALMKVPNIRRQLKKIDQALLAEDLREYGAWSTEDLQNHEQNLARILWIACGDIVERLL